MVDDRALAAASGVLHGSGPDPDLAVEFADVLRGTVPARPDDRPTVFAPIGLPWQDLALAWPVHLAARSMRRRARLRLPLTPGFHCPPDSTGPRGKTAGGEPDDPVGRHP